MFLKTKHTVGKSQEKGEFGASFADIGWSDFKNPQHQGGNFAVYNHIPQQIQGPIKELLKFIYTSHEKVMKKKNKIQGDRGEKGISYFKKQDKTLERKLFFL